jgi:hypothetical protein
MFRQFPFIKSENPKYIFHRILGSELSLTDIFNAEMNPITIQSQHLNVLHPLIGLETRLG